MKISQNLKQKQLQKLAMTQQMQQSIKILKSTNEELTKLIKQRELENPFIEVHDSHPQNSETVDFTNLISNRQPSLDDYLLDQVHLTMRNTPIRTSVIYFIENLDDKLIGGLMLIPLDDQTIRMMQVAVDNKYQGEGIGRELVQYAEKRARAAGYHQIVMHAMLNVIGFYEKLGYHQEGDIFEERGITFAKMVKDL